MIGIVIVAHGALADALLAAVEHVVGPQPHMAAIAIAPNDDLRERQADINRAAESVNQGSGVVLVTDMFGGTPSNLALGASTGPEIEVIYGANLPLLVKLAKMREQSLAEASRAAVEAGRKYVNSTSSILDAAPSPR